MKTTRVMRTKRLVSVVACIIVGTPALAFGQHRRFVHMTASGAKGAQIAPARSAGDDSGRITGTVLDPDGKPVPDTIVVLRRVGDGLMSPPASRHTDDRGRFRFEGLSSGAYLFSFPPDLDDYGDQRLYRPGDVVTLRTDDDQKGSVITGTVKTASGEPAIEAPVRATRVANVDGTRTRPGLDL